MRKCSNCNIERPNTEYRYRGGGRKGLQATCNDCARERIRQHRAYTRRVVGRWKMQKGCSQCDFKAEHPCQLELDHINPKDKRRTGNSKAFDPAWSVNAIKAELAKCQVVCGNCHALKTYLNKEHLNSYK